MALVTDILKNKLSLIFDKEYSGFVDFPSSFEDAANKWSDAFDSYASLVTPPSTTNSTAKEAFRSTFLTITDSNYTISFPQCFTAYCAALAIGMQPAFSAIPPQGIINFDSVYALGLSGASSSECISLIVTIVHSWMLSGIAVNNQSGVSTNWV